MTISRRTVLKRSLGGFAAAGLGSMLPMGAGKLAAAELADPSLPRSWGINTEVDGWRSYSDTLSGAIRNVSQLVSDTTLPIVREGLTSGSYGNDGDPIRWDIFFNDWADELARTGRKMALQVGAQNVSNPGLRYDEDWEDRITHKFRDAAQYIYNNPTYRKTVSWFLISNEPDWANNLQWNVPRLLRLHQLAYNAVKSVSSSMLVEGCTYSDPVGKNLKLRDLLNAGVTRYCDFVGFHCYISCSDLHWQAPNNVWEAMRAASQNYGWPMRPIVCSETGLNRTTNFSDPNGPTGPEGIKYWQYLNYTQMARFGVSRCLYFSMGGPYPNFNQIDYRDGYDPYPTYDTMIAALQPKPLSTMNGTFAAFEDKYSNWIIHFRPAGTDFVDGTFKEWTQASFRRDGAHCEPNATDSGYLEMTKGRYKMARRAVDRLYSRPYRATVWVYLTAGTAYLRVYGFNQNNGDGYVEDKTTTVGQWVMLRVTFTPITSIIGVDRRAVISLEYDGKASCWWDSARIFAVAA